MHMEKIINLGDNIKLVYQEPEVFSKYHGVYYGQKYGNYYFRNSPSIMIEKAKYIDSGYFILKDNNIVGGVFLKPNFMTDLFVVPPYDDYGYLLEKILGYLKVISKKEENIEIQEVIEEYVPLYESKGCVLFERGFWMIRPTEPMNCTLPEGFVAKDLDMEYKEDIADLLVEAYTANPIFESVATKAEYIKHVEEAVEYSKVNSSLYNATKIVIDKETNMVVGTCLHMEFEGVPLIMSFAVRPKYQGKGIGSYLIKNSIDSTSSEYKATRLYVYYNNSAIKVYEHYGFIKNKTLNDMHLVNN
ncbi:Acetyltransferase (GNAT) family protein [Clostridium collagenovorans DSM 3089]|uniref:Acetyltransferase (GNAT) family protein n=2 Tax=Clostridium TaxID=1485 RepID=A0A1M5S6M1_9CLOT|nr:Acetyltransferase (GNAT) family protein [Clostridium collagenovorans DSM 3089]